MNTAGLRRYVLLIAGRMLKWTTVDGLGSRFGWIHATLPPADTTEGEQNLWQSVRNMVGFGFRSAPVAGSEVVVSAPRGGAVNAVAVASDHLGYGPTDLAEGDTVVYSKAHAQGVVCVVRVYADGNIRVQTSKDNCHVIAKPGTGGKVKLGDDVDANLDAVALYEALKTNFDAFVAVFNAHIHTVGMANTSTSTTAASDLDASPRSSNVVAKKP